MPSKKEPEQEMQTRDTTWSRVEKKLSEILPSHDRQLKQVNFLIANCCYEDSISADPVKIQEEKHAKNAKINALIRSAFDKKIDVTVFLFLDENNLLENEELLSAIPNEKVVRVPVWSKTEIWQRAAVNYARFWDVVQNLAQSKPSDLDSKTIAAHHHFIATELKNALDKQQQLSLEDKAKLLIEKAQAILKDLNHSLSVDIKRTKKRKTFANVSDDKIIDHIKSETITWVSWMQSLEGKIDKLNVVMPLHEPFSSMTILSKYADLMGYMPKTPIFVVPKFDKVEVVAKQEASSAPATAPLNQRTTVNTDALKDKMEQELVQRVAVELATHSLDKSLELIIRYVARKYQLTPREEQQNNNTQSASFTGVTQQAEKSMASLHTMEGMKQERGSVALSDKTWPEPLTPAPKSYTSNAFSLFSTSSAQHRQPPKQAFDATRSSFRLGVSNDS